MITLKKHLNGFPPPSISQKNHSKIFGMYYLTADQQLDSHLDMLSSLTWFALLQKVTHKCGNYEGNKVSQRQSDRFPSLKQFEPFMLLAFQKD